MTGSFVDQLYLLIFFGFLRKEYRFESKIHGLIWTLIQAILARNGINKEIINYSADIIKQRLKNFYTDYAI